MRRFNLLAAELDRSSERDGYRWCGARVGQRVGGEQIGACLYELGDGQRSHPYHVHHGIEEWLLVLAGTPTLRDPEGEHELAPGDVICFLVGPHGAHKVTNRSNAVARILMLSTMPENEISIAVYPGSDKVGVWPWPGRRLRMSGAVGYWDGES